MDVPHGVKQAPLHHRVHSIKGHLQGSPPLLPISQHLRNGAGFRHLRSRRRRLPIHHPVRRSVPILLPRMAKATTLEPGRRRRPTLHSRHPGVQAPPNFIPHSLQCIILPQVTRLRHNTPHPVRKCLPPLRLTVLRARRCHRHRLLIVLLALDILPLHQTIRDLVLAARHLPIALHPQEGSILRRRKSLPINPFR